MLEIDPILVQELNYDVGVCDFEKVLAAWKKIQAKKPLIAYGDVSLEQLRRMLEELSPVGLSIQTLSPTLEIGVEKREQVYGS
jgi:FlaA1/EpsC-like NDP-sugar epimerase